MTRILVMSDTHGDITGIQNTLPMLRAMEPHAVYHLGDFTGDAQWLKPRLTCPLYSLPGNCDVQDDGLAQMDTEHEGVRVFAAHGHLLQVKMELELETLKRAARERNCAAALFGHTHIPVVTRGEGILLVNPGSLTFPRISRKGTMALLIINKGEVDATIIEA